jgi:outer membrane protein assembly factor BamB
MPRYFAAFSFACTILLSASASSDADNWPRWRGPNFDGVAPAGDYPLRWGKDDKIAWNYELSERSGSTPVVWDRSIFLSSTSGETNVLISLDRDGKEQWTRTIGDEQEGKHGQYGSGSHPSPVTDGRHVYAYYKSGDIACFDFSGNQVWHKNLQDEYGEDTLWWDLGSSPALSKNAVVIAVMHEGPSYVVALDKQSGSELWKQDRTFQVNREADNSYTTPIVLDRDGREIVLIAGADHVTAHDAQTGAELWRAGGLNPQNREFFRSIASPVLAGDVLVVPYSRGETLTAFRIDGSGDVTDTHTLWKIRTPQGNEGRVDVSTPAAENGRVYLVGERGLAFCIDAATGNVLWQKSLPGSRHSYRASPVVTADRIYYTREDGTTFVLSKPKQDDEPELLATNELGETTIASPVFVDGMILIRTFDNLYCIR